jgi:hypothetical protein
MAEIANPAVETEVHQSVELMLLQRLLDVLFDRAFRDRSDPVAEVLLLPFA